MTKQVRWGIVGAGHIANTFAADMRHVENAELAAVAARNQASANDFARRHGIDKHYQGYAALFADPDIDAVYVATPHTLHLPNASDALRAGKAVMCEKPITVSAAECQALLDVAAETNNYLLEAMWTWFLPAIRQAKNWVSAGRIGEIRQLRAELGFPKDFDPQSRLFDPSLAGGCLLDMGVYPIAIAQFFLDRAPVEIQAVSGFASNGVDDDIAMLFDYGDCVATLATSFRCKLPNTAYVIGSEGHIEIPHAWSARECHLHVMDDRVDSFYDDRLGSGFEFQIAAASSDILQGREQSAVVPHAASLAFQQQMDRVRATF
jgi:predicted dehydrogenase